MSTIDDLRASLAEHAELADDAVAGRSAEVAARGRVVRRRRRAGALGAIVVAVLTAGTLTFLSQRDTVDPAAEVVGVPVPEKMTASGWTYEYAEKVEAGSGTADLALTQESVPRLVSWATEGENQQVRVSGTLGNAFTSTLPDLTDFVLVPPNTSHDLEFSADGSLGLVVYTLSDDEPEGFHAYGMTFRRHIGDRTLQTATIAQGSAPLGAGTVVELGADPLYLAPYCTFLGGEQPRYRVEIDGDERFGGSCGGRNRFVGFADPGAAQVPVREMTSEPGDKVRLVIRAVGGGGPVPDDVRLGLGVYTGPAGGRTVLGDPADEHVEHGGHTWRLAAVREGSLAEGIEAAVPESEQRVLVGFRARTSGTHRLTVQGTVPGAGGAAEFSFDEGSNGGDRVLGVADPGSGNALLQGRGAGAGDQGALLFYELAD